LPSRAIAAARSRTGLPLYLAALIAVCTVVVVVGCEEEEVRVYHAPKEPAPTARMPTAAPAADQMSAPTPASAAATGEAQRLLGAIVPAEDGVWFLKALDDAARLDPHAPAFAELAASLHFHDDDLHWALPDGWRQQPGSGMRYATLVAGDANPPVEIGVFKLGLGSGSVLDNVNRWRRQIGLEPLDADELNDAVDTRQVGGQPATLVDFTGPGADPTAAMGDPHASLDDRGNAPASASPGPAAPAPTAEPSFQAPSDWRKQDDPGSMLLHAWNAGSEDAPVEITLSRLPGTGGGLLDNVNRWRRQLGLGPIFTEALMGRVQPVQIDGITAVLTEIGEDESERHITAVMITRPGESWFVKMTGPAAAVEREKPTFLTFVQSFRFDEEVDVER